VCAQVNRLETGLRLGQREYCNEYYIRIIRIEMYQDCVDVV